MYTENVVFIYLLGISTRSAWQNHLQKRKWGPYIDKVNIFKDNIKYEPYQRYFELHAMEALHFLLIGKTRRQSGM